MHAHATAVDLTLARTFLAVAAVLVAGSLLGRAVRFARQPAVVGEIAAGIILGPSLLALLPGDLVGLLFPASIRGYLSAIAQLGLLLFIFMIGWEFEKRLLGGRRAIAVSVSLSSVFLAFALGAGLGLMLHQRHAQVGGHHVSATAFALFMGAAMSVTAFPVLARILTDNHILGTRVGAIALASAAVDDVLAWCLLAFVSAEVTAGNGQVLTQILLLAVGYVAAMFLVVKPALALLVRRLTAHQRVSPYLLPVLAAGVFLSAYATTWIGIHAIFGAFLFGFVMPREPAELLQLQLRRPLESVATLLLPVFFIVTGLAVDIGSLTGREWLELAAVLVVASVGKLVGAAVPARLFGMDWKDAGTLGLLMNTRGLTELIILNAGVSLGILDRPMFTMMVMMALFTTAAAGPLLPARYRRSRDLDNVADLAAHQSRAAA
jgi:Kef-type K+ transport system membrane component KefB